MDYSIQWLKEKTQKNKKLEFVFFWGHTPKNINIVDKSCFSQWYPSTFEVEKIIYKTAEHWMMAQKALLFEDIECYEQILKSSTAADAKKIGRMIKKYNDEV